MFSFFKKQSILKRVLVTLSVLLCLSAALVFTGCSTDPDDSENLNGTWIYSSPGYSSSIKINSSAKTIVYEENYEGDIVNSPDYAAVNGVLIVKFTKYWETNWEMIDPEGDFEDINNWTSTTAETDANNGKFGAVYWRDLKAGSVRMADAYTNAGFTHVILADLATAQTSFTLERAGEYVDWSITGTYTKTN